MAPSEKTSSIASALSRFTYRPCVNAVMTLPCWPRPYWRVSPPNADCKSVIQRYTCCKRKIFRATCANCATCWNAQAYCVMATRWRRRTCSRPCCRADVCQSGGRATQGLPVWVERRLARSMPSIRARIYSKQWGGPRFNNWCQATKAADPHWRKNLESVSALCTASLKRWASPHCRPMGQP